MYSLFRPNNQLLTRTKCVAKGGRKLVHIIAPSHCLLWNPLVSVMSRRVISLSSASNYNNFINYNLPIRDCDTLKIRCESVLLHKSNSAFIRNFHVGANFFGNEPLKPSSKVEETVHVLKEKVKEQAKEATSSTPTAVQEKAVATPPKKTIKQRIVAELVHYYHGFKLLFIDINVSRKLIWRVLQGYSLTRREHKLLIRTVGDLFRLVPFSVFIIVPFMELLLPVFIKLFPGMLPSTFQTASEKEDKMKQALKVKLEMAKFLQRTLDEMAVTSKGHSSQSAKEFAQFFEKVRTSGEMTTSEEIMKFSRLFEDEITLDSLPRPQLMALCRVLEMNPIGSTNFLRFQLRLKLRSLIADDVMIQREGIDSLSQSELQQACRARGMRALGVSEERLKAQLLQWLDLSLNKKVPSSLLLLSQAFMLPETTTTSEKLAATISALPDVVGTHTKAVIGEREGKVDNKTKIEVIKEEITKIKEERKEQQEEEAQLKLKEAVEKDKEVMVDPAPVLVDKSVTMEPALRAVLQDIKKTSLSDRIADCHLTTKDLEALEKALESLGKDQNKLLIEKEELQELRQEMAEYQEDIADLQKVTSCAGKEMEVKESRAAQLLFRRVNKMITKMDSVLAKLEKKEETITPTQPKITPQQQGVSKLRVDDLIAALHKLETDPNSPRPKLLSEVLGKLDGDQDGIIKVETVLKVFEMIEHEKVKLSKKQIDELLALIYKEEAIELDDQIIKALRKKDKSSVEGDDKDNSAVSSAPSSSSEPKPKNKGPNNEKMNELDNGKKITKNVDRKSEKLNGNSDLASSVDSTETNSERVVLTINDPKKEKNLDEEEISTEKDKNENLRTTSGTTLSTLPPPQILDHKSPTTVQQPKELR